MTTRRVGLLVAVPALVALLLSAALSAQATDEQLAERYLEARALFQTANQPDSIQLFGELITLIEAQAAAGPLSDAASTVLADSLSSRADAFFNAGDQTEAAADLRRLITLDPSVQLDSNLVSPLLVELFDELRSEIVGFLNLVVLPEDATVTVGGQPMGPASGVPMPAGTHAVVAERPGYAPYLQPVEIAAGGETDVLINLERSSAVLRILTRPSGAAVSVDGRLVGETVGTAPVGTSFRNEAAEFPPEEFSDVLVVADIGLGRHRIDVVQDTYRTYRAEVDVAALADYQAVIVLHEAVGALVFDGLPDTAVVRINGEEVSPERAAGAAAGPSLTLPIGEYRLEVSEPTEGVFETAVVVEDESETVVAVVLRPVLAWLGNLGGDDLGDRRIAEALTEALSNLDLWLVRDETDAGPAVVQAAGATVEVLRALGGAARLDAGAVDWSAVQAAVDDQIPASIYVLGVLSDDLVATHADLWIWLAAPDPSLPGRLRVPLNSDDPAPAIVAGFAPSLQLARPWLGATLIDSDAADGALVVRVAARSPAERAGLQVGDEVRVFNGMPLDRAATVSEFVSSAELPASVSFQIARAAGSVQVDVPLGSSPAVLPFSGESLLYPVVLSSLDHARASGGDAAWIVPLNQAMALMQASAWEPAVRILREIDAPSGPGLGQGAVDYWLGVALTALGPSYLGIARRSFERAALTEGATLDDNDGPLVAPRARAREAALGGADPER